MTQPPPPPLPAPPASWLLAYRLLGLRLPAEHRAWMARDTASPSFLWWRSLRTLLWGQVFVVLYALGQHAGHAWPSRTTFFRAELLVLAVMLFSSREALVRRALRWHRVDKRGNPATKTTPFSMLANVEVALLAVAVLLAWTGGAKVFGIALRPTGVAAAPCREADPAVMDRIVANKTNKAAKYVTTRMVRDGLTDVVVALTDLDGVIEPAPTGSPTPTPKPSGTPKPKVILEIWVVTEAGVSRIGAHDDATTGHPSIERPDRGTFPAISRAADCLAKKPVR